MESEMTRTRLALKKHEIDMLRLQEKQMADEHESSARRIIEKEMSEYKESVAHSLSRVDQLLAHVVGTMKLSKLLYSFIQVYFV